MENEHISTHKNELSLPSDMVSFRVDHLPVVTSFIRKIGIVETHIPHHDVDEIHNFSRRLFDLFDGGVVKIVTLNPNAVIYSSVLEFSGFPSRR